MNRRPAYTSYSPSIRRAAEAAMRPAADDAPVVEPFDSFGSFLDSLGEVPASDKAPASAPKREAQRRPAPSVSRVSRKESYQLFCEEHKDVIGALRRSVDWSSFARSLVDQLDGGKEWSDAQLRGASSMAAKVLANEEKRAAAKAAEAAAPKITADLSGVWDMFETAMESGYKKPVYRAEGLVIKKASTAGRNPGALYVMSAETGEYLGKVVQAIFSPVATGKWAAEPLAIIAADPKGAAVRYGQRTGECACCGRALTKHASIEMGIGPICADKWGF
jgi:hypothetical protein